MADAPIVAIVAHGQPGDPAPLQAQVEALAARVGVLLPGVRTLGATLADAASLRRLAGVRLVYPLFMAEGWFTRSEMPRRLGLAGVEGFEVLRPLGLDPGLPAVGARLADEVAEAAGIDPATARLVIVGHGSKGARASAEATRTFAAALTPLADFAEVTCAFIEEAPFLSDLPPGPASVCLPFLATEAGHATGDVPGGWAAAGTPGPIAPPVGLAPEVPALIARSIAARL